MEISFFLDWSYLDFKIGNSFELFFETWFFTLPFVYLFGKVVVKKMIERKN
jgi:hypothetical protein